jgi:hypothetical protein
MVRETHKVGRCSARRDACERACAGLMPLSMVLAWSEPALAYVGPGAGISMLGALGAVIVAILFALGGLIWWPVRTMLRRKKQAANVAATADGDHAHGD